MITSEFKYGNQKVPMHLGYVVAHGALADRGLDVLSMVKHADQIVQTIMIDDSTMLKVWFYYLGEAGIVDPNVPGSFDEALETLDQNPQGLEPFRKAFWEMVVGFSPSKLQQALRAMWKEAENQLKTAGEKNSITSTSLSQPESE